MHLLEKLILNNPIERWLVATGVALAAYAILTLTKSFVLRRLRRLPVTPAYAWNQGLIAVLSSTRALFLQLICFSTFVFLLDLSPKAEQVISKSALIMLLVQICFWGSALIRFWVDYDGRSKGVEDGARTQTMRAVGFLLNGILYLTVALWGLDNFGVNINALVAGLGVGGIAIALAVQKILGDLFASLTIVLDKPFVYGDQIAVGEFNGTVEKVGLKTTRIRSQSGEQLIFPNSDLLESRIRNFRRMQERRISFMLALSVDTPNEKLKTLPVRIQNIIESQKHARFQRAHFKEIGTSALNFEIVYWITDSDYLTYMDTQQSINWELLEMLRRDGIELAVPPLRV